MRRELLGSAFAIMLASCNMEPSNIEFGLRVDGEVEPRQVRISDPAAALHIRVVVSNPTDDSIFVVTGAPPYSFTGDPAVSQGLSHAFRIASATNPLHGGPSGDWWGSQIDTVPPHWGSYAETTLTLTDWRELGYPLEPGEYRLRTYYNGREGEPVPFTLRP